MKRYLSLAIIVLLAACGHDDRHPDISKIDVDLKLERFERDFFRIDTNQIGGGLAHLRNAYPDFYGIFMNNIVGINPADSNGQLVVRYMLRDYRPVNTAIQQKYPDLGWLKDELTTGFRYTKYYYPDYPVPKLLTFIATFDAPPVVVAPAYLGIGLQQFAGKDFPAYQEEEIHQMYPDYIARRFDKEFIATRAMAAVADDIYPNQSVGRPLLEQFVEGGKQWYLLDHLLPDAADSAKTGYTGRQLEWLRRNEGNAWGYILKNENLYSIEPNVIQTYLGESPFTQGLPEESPGNIGQWLGWRIVQEYARRSGKPLPEVLKTPARAVYEGSKYKPK
ncbi:MAG: hypothetical protein EOO16_01265 [Chitinophagaceae bacterium]|nr:MAG: hypothetical protein EOO16_01265 [Chitinophagaceae bacterium]